jgi:hypothetical protein
MAISKKTSSYKGIGIVKRIYRDLRRGNDPTVGWGAPKYYLEFLTWIRATLVLGVTVGGFLGLALIYVQLQQAPSRRLLLECQQRQPSGDCTNPRSGQSADSYTN